MDRIIKEKEITLEKIVEILQSGNLDEFIGYVENTFFEAKSCKPWIIDSSNSKDLLNAKIEMAKDIGCIANKNEGYIILGLNTPTNKEKSARDYVTGRISFKQEDFYTEDFLIKQLKGFIYPVPLIKLEWYPNKANSSEGLGVIHILPENEKNRLYITTINVDDKGVINHHFGIPMRDGDQPGWIKEKMVYDLIRQRPSDWQSSHSRIIDKLDKISDQIDDLGGIPVTPSNLADVLNSRMEELSNEQ